MSTALLAAMLLGSAGTFAPSPHTPGARVAELSSPARGLDAAVRFLVSAQGTLASPDGNGVAPATWAFEKGGTVAAPNASGVVALALVSASDRGWQRTSALAAATAWGRARIDQIAAGAKTFDPDVEALAALGRSSGDPQFLAAARMIFEQRHGMANGREIVEYFFSARAGIPSLVGYDVALALRAALALGDFDKAREIAAAMALTRTRWDVPCAQGFHLTGRAALLEALPPGLSADSDSLRAQLRQEVLATQDADGSWGVRNTQATAYSVRALLAAGDSAARGAAGKGVGFLRATQLPGGGWATFNDFMPEPFVGETVYEVSSEVVLALLWQ